MRFCSFLQEPDITVRNQSFQQAWQELLAYEEKLDWPKECKACPARTVCFKCAASLATMSGSLEKISQPYCDKIRQMYAQKKGKLQ